MKSLWSVFLSIWRGRWRAFFIGVLLSTAVVAAGVALLGLSGWFITAAGTAGLAGAAIAFDVFRPSAGIRFLAFGRAASRYGERLATHDATLRGLARLRVKLLGSILNRPYSELQRLRGSERLNLLTIDVDALDGLALRLILPTAAALLSLITAALFVAWLTLPSIAFAQLSASIIGVGAAAAFTLRRARKPSRMAQRAMQALRMRVIDMMRGQTELVIAGRLGDQQAAIISAQDRLQTAQAETDRIDRRATALIGIFATIAAAASLWLGAMAVLDHQIDPASAALGFFVALALFEAIAPLARGLGELGKMMDAARRVGRELGHPGQDETDGKPASTPGMGDAPKLALKQVHYQIGGRVVLNDVSIEIKQGDIAALAGASGRGKTTILNIARGLILPTSGTVLIEGCDIQDLSKAARAALIGYLPQRTSLVSGSFADNLRLADPDAPDDALWEALRIAAIDDLVRQRGGLSADIGEAGRGLSGGEKRRLALARTVLTTPALLLLDEPTEGLDGSMADTVLENIRLAMPQSAILVAAHRPEEKRWAGRIVTLQ